MRTNDIIGRKPELETLKYLYDSQKSEFLAIYGRRRVGKSFLIEEAFEGEISFTAVGIFKKDTDSSKRIFKLRFSFKNMKYDVSRKYYLVAFEEKTGLEVLRHEIVIDIAFADDFGF